MSKTRTICTMTNKGGVLKSTLSVNIACMYSLKNYRVLIVDMDNQANQALSFGLEPEDFTNTIYDVLTNDVPAREAIINVYDEVKKDADEDEEVPLALKGIDLLPSNNSMSAFELKTLRDPSTADYQFEILKRALEPVKGFYDVIMIDSPPNLGLTSGNALVAADEVIIPFHPEPYSMRSLVSAITTLEDFREDMNLDVQILGVVGTKIKEGTNLHRDIMQACRQFCDQMNIHCFFSEIPETIKGAGTVHYEFVPNVLSKMKKVKDLKKLQDAYFELFDEIQEKQKEGAVSNG